ncbi:hypothetical protein Gpo141_00003843 [Globisporangium polare]
MASSIRYLLPIPSPSHSNDDDNDDASDDGDGREDREPMVELYHQAKPLVHPHSSAAIKTLGKMLDDPELMRRMLQRNQKLSGGPLGGQRASCSSSLDAAGASHQQASEPLEFMEVCKEMVLRFDPQARRSREIRLTTVKHLLLFYELHVDDVAYRRWEQRLPEDTERVSVSMLTQAFLLWFNETHLIEHFKNFKQAQQQQPQQVYGSKDNPLLLQRANKTLEKEQSAPLLHPFELLRQHNDATLSFDYEKCVQSPVVSSKTLSETNSLKSKLIIHATQELRRKTKILSRLDAPSPATPQSQGSPTLAPTLTHASSSPSLKTTAATANTTATTGLNQLHERLHQEKLARDVLRRCSTHSLAPSNRAKASKSTPQLRQQKTQQALAKHMRLQNVETAKAFSASVAMISRHIQNEELRDLRELHREQQVQVVDDRKYWGRAHRAHCRALADDKKTQRLREVHAMKAIAREELELVRSYLGLRQDMLKCNKQPFALSESTSTLFQQPPEILAAKATAKTGKQKKKLLAAEKEHLDHVRSLQLLDYVYDKQRAVMEALKPKAEAALVEVELDPEAQAASQQDLQRTVEDLWEQLRAHGVDMSALLPPPNSPPAALKYFGSSRPAQLPPFASSAERTLS